MLSSAFIPLQNWRSRPGNEPAAIFRKMLQIFSLIKGSLIVRWEEGFISWDEASELIVPNAG